jgi:transposase
MAKTRRTFTAEFKAEAVRLVTEQGRSFVEAAHDLDIGESTLRSWRQAIVADGERAFPGKGNSPAHGEEMRRPRAEVKRLTMGRDILKRATAFFAGESSSGTTSSSATAVDGRSG